MFFKTQYIKSNILCFFLIFFIFTKPALGSTELLLSSLKQQENIQLINTFAQKFGIHPALALAIAIKESGINPLAIHLSTPRKEIYRLGWKLKQLNIKYKYYYTKKRHHYSVFPDSKEKAIKILNWIQNKKFIWYDIGLFQISHNKIKDFNINPIDILHPEINTFIALKILDNCYEQENFSTIYALECYHHGISYKKITNYSRTILHLANLLLTSFDILPSLQGGDSG